MDRQKLARLIWKLWKRRNYYKYWYEYEKTDNDVWARHFDERKKYWDEEKRKRGDNP